MDKKQIYIWGTGAYAKEINDYCKAILNSIDVLGYIDNDEKKKGSVFYGKEVLSPSVLNEKNAQIFIAVRDRSRIIEQIQNEYPWCADGILEDNFFIKQQLLSRYKSTDDDEIGSIVRYLDNNPLRIFNYEFTRKYEPKNNIFFDDISGLFFVGYDDKKMYFSERFTDINAVDEYYRSILVEQDNESPHCYFANDMTYGFKDKIIVDAGAAEGNFTLSIIDSIKKAYLFEPDEAWFRALQLTFSPYKDRVILVNKAVSDYSDEFVTTIEQEVGEDHVDCIKLDVEGEELYALKGAKSFLVQKDIMCIVCTYHQEYAYDAIKNELMGYGFQTSNSKGYMYYPESTSLMRPPVLRRGLLFAKK